jgi:hypothetical protein
MTTKMNKRGITAAFLVGIIIIIASFLIILAFFPQIKTLFTTTVDKDVCHTSVLLRSEAITKGGEFFGGKILINDIPLKCKTEDIAISETDKNRIENQIANAMYDCWWMLGEGEKNFIEQKAGTENNCVICSMIKFSDDSKKLENINNFNQYLIVNTIPGKNITYAEFLYGKAALPAMNLDLNQDYAITFHLSKVGFWKDKWANVAIAAGVVGAGIYTIATLGTGLIVVVPISVFITGGLAREGYVMARTTSIGDVGLSLMPSAETIRNLGCTSIQSIP